MIIDILIVIFAISALYRGREIGFIKQLCSTVGFFGGLFLGAWLQQYTSQLANTQTGQSIVTLATTLGSAIIFLSIGELIGSHLKQRVRFKQINVVDNGFGGALGIVSLLITVWLLAAIASSLPVPGLQAEIQDSRIVRALERNLPSAPKVISSIGHLVSPNGFPQVFISNEPQPNQQVTLPELQSFQAAINQSRDSVVKIEGRGCGGIVNGSGFVAGSNLVATNAHVVAGISSPYVQDANGTHRGTVIWFDPKMDFAVLRVSNLAGRSLVIYDQRVPTGTAAAVLGYPGGGAFTAKPAAVSNQFTANGRDIYDRSDTLRDVYELQANIISGNSGGPLISQDGKVIGMIFAASTNHKNIGYALTSDQLGTPINKAVARNQTVSTGRCAD